MVNVLLEIFFESMKRKYFSCYLENTTTVSVRVCIKSQMYKLDTHLLKHTCLDQQSHLKKENQHNYQHCKLGQIKTDIISAAFRVDICNNI